MQKKPIKPEAQPTNSCRIRFQMVSLLKLAKVTEEGVQFLSPHDGTPMLEEILTYLHEKAY